MPSSSLLAACHSTPTVGMIFFGCCARATTGHAATPPTRPINSRRRMVAPKHQDAAVYPFKLDAWKTPKGRSKEICLKVPDFRFGSWPRENAEIEFANGNFVSTSINLKNKSAGDGCRDKTIEKTILRAFRARTFSRSQGQNRKYSLRADDVRYPRKRTQVGHQAMSEKCQQRKSA